MARGVRWRFGWLWACLAFLTQAGCGDSSVPVEERPTVERPAGDDGVASETKTAGAAAAATTEEGSGSSSAPGLTAGGGAFSPTGAASADEGEPPSDSTNPADSAEAKSAPDSTGKSNANKSGKKLNPLRSPGTKPAEDAVPQAKPASDAGDDSPREKPGETAKSPGGVDSPVAKPGQSRIAIFAGWTKPDAALVLTGRQNGYIEPCGCAGLVNQKGGMARRLTMIRDLSERGWPVAALDVGNQVKRFGRQSEIKFQIALDGLRQMDYRVIGLGPDDLRLSSGELFAAASEEPYRFVSSNVTVLDPSVTPLFRVLDVGELKVGVTTVLGDEYRERVKSDEVSTRSAEEGLKAAAKGLAAEKCDWLVLLVYGSMDETRALAKKFPQFQLIVTSGGAEEPAFEPDVLPGTQTRVIQVGAKGMYAGVVGLYREGKTRVRYQRVPLDDRFADAPEMLRLLGAYQDQLREAGLEGLEVKASPHPTGRSFVGSEKCGECHSKAFAKWQETGHGKATESLVNPGERSEIQRHFDPECISCHVTGWEPQRFFPFKSGYLGLKETPALKGSGCENCHGPGGAHVAAEEGGKSAASLLKQLRGEMQLPLKAAQAKCVECHDHDNSPQFHHEGAFEKYWQKVAHPGKD